MTEPSPANLDLAIVLPLGVVANQLTRIEADLRFLSMKASAHAVERENGQLAAKVSGGLEKINEALDRIRSLVADLEANLQAASRTGQYSGQRSSRKSSADRDD
jgi:hypothetical protein